MRSAFFVWI